MATSPAPSPRQNLDSVNRISRNPRHRARSFSPDVCDASLVRYFLPIHDSLQGYGSGRCMTDTVRITHQCIEGDLFVWKLVTTDSLQIAAGQKAQRLAKPLFCTSSIHLSYGRTSPNKQQTLAIFANSGARAPRSCMHQKKKKEKRGENPAFWYGRVFIGVLSEIFARALGGSPSIPLKPNRVLWSGRVPLGVLL